MPQEIAGSPSTNPNDAQAPEEKKCPPNYFIVWRIAVFSALKDPNSYALGSEQVRVVSSFIWHDMSAEEKEPWREEAARYQAMGKRSTATRKADRLPDGVNGFDVLPVDRVLHALRQMIRCLVDRRFFDSDAMRSLESKKKTGYKYTMKPLEASMSDALAYHRLRNSIFQRWLEYKQPGNCTLQPVFDSKDALLTPQDLRAFRVDGWEVRRHDWINATLL